MVQVSPSPPLDVTPPSVHSEEGEDKQEDPVGSPCGTSVLEVNTPYNDYENYIENGLICLKHKIRNLEKKKLKLEDYKRRLKRGDVLNKDQMAAVEKYEELLHHLAFAREMHKTLDGLTQTLLRAQRKAAKKEQLAKAEVEKKRLSNVLRVQHLLHSLQQEHIRSDLLTGHNQAPHVSTQKLQGLSQLGTLLGVQRDHRLSLEVQMEQASLVYIDLLDGKNKPVAGSTYKLLKEEINGLLDCKYFSCLPPPPQKSAEVLLSSAKNVTSKPKPNNVSKKESWKEDFQAMKEQEPPDSWDMEFQDGAASAQTAVHKPWRGAAAFIPKVPGTSKKQSADGKQRKERRAKGEQHAKLAVYMDVPAEMFDSPTALPKDPVLRRQHLEDLMTKIHSSFSFVQDSLLDGESSPTKGHPRLKRQTSRSPSPLAQTDLRSQTDALPKAMHPLPLAQSSPLPARPLERKASLVNGDQSLETCDLELSADLPLVPTEFAERKRFASPLLYRRESNISLDVAMITESGKQSPNGVTSCTPTPPQGQPFSTPPTRRTLSSSPFQSMSPVPQNGELDYKPDFGNPRYTTVSTQTSPVFTSTEDDPQPDYAVDGGPIFLSPGQSSGSVGQTGQPYYSRGSVRGGAYIPQNHFRDSGPPLYAVRDYRRGGRHNPNAAWSDSSQVSSPDREGSYTIVDSGHGDSLTPRSHHHHTNMLPMQLYPLSQRLHISFSASLTANFAPGNLDQPIVFDHLHCNLGEMYNTHIGRFTCPINGTYVFNFNILKLAANSPLFINLMCNEEVMASAYANDGAPDHDTASNSAILTLFQGDQVWLRLHRGAVYGSTWNYSTFSGFLLYQD